MGPDCVQTSEMFGLAKINEYHYLMYGIQQLRSVARGVGALAYRH